MGLNKSNHTNKKFVSIAGGKLRQRVEPEVEGAEEREIEYKDGTKKTVYELIYDNLDGYIENISFKDTDFGKMINIAIDGVVISLNTEGKHFSTFARRLPSIDFKKKVYLTPYDFESDGKRMVGISVVQDDEKIDDYFYDGKKNINGIPKFEGNKDDKGDWKIYFIQVEKFLVKHIEDMDKEYFLQEDKKEEKKEEVKPTKDEDGLPEIPEINHKQSITPEELPFN